jgi:hypothetical protein
MGPIDRSQAAFFRTDVPSSQHNVASRLRAETGTAILLPTYDQVRKYIDTLKQEPKVRQARGGEKGPRRERQSPSSFALSIPAPAQLAKGAMSTQWNSM